MKLEMKFLSLMTLMTLLWSPSLCVLKNQPEMCEMVKMNLENVVRSYGNSDKDLNKRLYKYSLRSLAYDYLDFGQFYDEDKNPDIFSMLVDLQNVELKKFKEYEKINISAEDKQELINDAHAKEAEISQKYQSYELELNQLKNELETTKARLDDKVQNLNQVEIADLCQQMEKFSVEIVKSEFDQNIDFESGENGEDLEQLCRNQQLIGQDEEFGLIRIKNFFDVYRVLQESQEIFEEKLKILNPEFPIEKNKELIKYVEKLKNDYNLAKEQIIKKLKDKKEEVEIKIKNNETFKEYVQELEKAKNLTINIANLKQQINSLHEIRFKAKADSFVSTKLNLRLTPDRISDVLEKPYKIDAFYRAVTNNNGTNNFVPLLNEANDTEPVDRGLGNDAQTFLNIIRNNKTDLYDEAGEEAGELVKQYTHIIKSDDIVDYLLGVLFADLQTVSEEATYLKCFSDETFASVLYFMSLTDIIRSNDKFLDGFFDRMPRKQGLMALRRILNLLSDHSIIEKTILNYARTAEDLTDNRLQLGKKVYSTFIEYDLGVMFLYLKKDFKNRFWVSQQLVKMKGNSHKVGEKILELMLSAGLKFPMFYFLHYISHSYLLSMSSTFAAEFVSDQVLEYAKEQILEHTLHSDGFKEKWKKFLEMLNNLTDSTLNTEKIYSLEYQNFLDLVEETMNVNYIHVLGQMKNDRVKKTYQHFLSNFNGIEPVIMINNGGGNNLLRKEIRRNLVVL